MFKLLALSGLMFGLTLTTGLSYLLSQGLMGLDGDMSQQVSVKSGSTHGGRVFIGGGIHGGK